MINILLYINLGCGDIAEQNQNQNSNPFYDVVV
jgi:hypothetical protein